jgi:two-component system CheB/CheR fusion protein
VSDDVDQELEGLLEYVKQNRGFDFTGYKRSSLTRRIQKRVEAVHVDGFGAYQERLASDPDEFAHLFDTILINVTSFFRDIETWRFLADEVLPRLVAERDPDQMIRVWSAGCASGQEAYSLAMLWCECLGDEAFIRRVKIYATDVDAQAIDIGRHARYPRRVIGESPVDIEKYFAGNASSVAFRSELRRSIIFGRHDLVQDPPISRIDLLLCRNTLMYLTTETQRRILKNLHFAVRDDGLLVLGRSEALATRSNLFTPFNLKRRVFMKVSARRQPSVERGLPVPTMHQPEQVKTMNLRDVGFDASGAPQVLIDPEGRLAAVNQTARTLFRLEPGDEGRPLQDLRFSYQPLELRSRVDEASATRRTVTVRNVELVDEGRARWYDVVVSPMFSPTGSIVGFSVTFIDVTAMRHVQLELDSSRSELETAYEELQSTVEELETTNEELQSTNEELETTNEELQSTNEELETMNEELQSTNEELETTNDELRQRSDELDGVNVFLEAILAGLEHAIVVVDRDVRIDIWSGRAEAQWGIGAEEVIGEHLANLDTGLPTAQLLPLVRACLQGDSSLTEIEVDAINRRGRPVRCRVRSAPLRSSDGDIVGAILLLDAEPNASG